MSILIVDDEEKILKFLARFLEQKGYNTTQCTSAEEALSAFLNRPGHFSLIVTDIKMPGMSGLKLIESIYDKGYDTPVIFMTGHLEEEENVIRSHLEFADLLLKPFDLNSLHSKVKKLLNDLPE